MDDLTLEQKQQQFHEFFTIKHKIVVNMLPVANDLVLPPVDELTDYMPYAFRVASDLTDIDVKALRYLRGLGEHASELADFLNHQSRKIDLLMSLVLEQQDEPEKRYSSYEYGGGGVTVISDSALELGSIAELKLFLHDEASAVFCFGEVIACQEQDDKYHISFIFTRIREQDQDLLVRASLHQQTLQLRKRSKQQNNERH